MTLYYMTKYILELSPLLAIILGTIASRSENRLITIALLVLVISIVGICDYIQIITILKYL